LENLKGKDRLKDLDRDGRLILKRIIKMESDGVDWMQVSHYW